MKTLHDELARAHGKSGHLLTQLAETRMRLEALAHGIGELRVSFAKMADAMALEAKRNE